MSHITSIFDILLWSLFCITHCNQAPLTVPRSHCNTTANISCPWVTIWYYVSTFSIIGPYFFVKNTSSYHSGGFWAMLHHVARIFTCWTVKGEAESKKCVVSTWWCNVPHSKAKHYICCGNVGWVLNLPWRHSFAIRRLEGPRIFPVDISQEV